MYPAVYNLIGYYRENAGFKLLNQKRANAIASLGIALMPLCLLIWRVVRGWQYFGAVNDLPEYSTAAKLAISGEASKIYRLPEFFVAQTAQFPGLGQRNVALFLPPFDVPLLIPLALIPAGGEVLFWTLLLFVCLVGALAIYKKLYNLSWVQFFWLSGLTFLSGPCIESIRIGQLSPILLLCLAVTSLYAVRGRNVVAGLVFAIMMLKPQQMWPLLVFLLGAKQYGLLKSTAGMFLALLLVSFLIFGVGGYADYMAAINSPASLDLMAPALNATVRGQLLRVFAPPSLIPNMAALFLLGASTVFTFLLGRRVAAQNQPDWLTIGFAGVLPIGLVTSMHCHDYDLLLLLPALLAPFVSDVTVAKQRLMQIMSGVTVIIFAQPLYMEIHYNYLCYGAVFNPYFLVLLLLGVVNGAVCWRAAGCRSAPIVAGESLA